jgi:formate dehydrogenase maturation protein FdhE
MRESWVRRIRRAEHLQEAHPAAKTLLEFYAWLLRAQEQLYLALDARPPSGTITQDLGLLRGAASPVLLAVAEHGPDPLVTECRSLIASGDAGVDRVLLTYWDAPTDRQFFAKAILQPYTQWLADSGIAPRRGVAGGPNRCPRCGGAPQLSILEPSGAVSADGSGRKLLCATCLTPWPFRRVLCPGCGEEDESKLGYFQAPALPHQRVDACESCRHYVKTIDLGGSGLAVPVVDEIAGVTLDVWARAQGYEKIELNLVGL